jgi:Ca2+-binding RTX toxin-like protein
VNNGAVPIVGGTATVANTSLIQAFGQDGNDTISLDESFGALPNANLFGGPGNDTLTGGFWQRYAVRAGRRGHPVRRIGK